MSHENFGKLEEQFKSMHINQKAPMTTEEERQENQDLEKTPINEDLVALIKSRNYPFRQEKSQRLYGPPPNWTAETPARGCEVFIGHIPRDCFEPELVPVFERVGKIYQFRLMVESEQINKGYGFCVYTNKEDAKRAVDELNEYEIRKGKRIGVCFSVDNCRLFVGGIPKDKTRDEILEQMMKITDCVKDVISYPSVNDKTKNRGFAFVEYTSHKAAAMARRKLHHQQPQLWGQGIHVDWAEPEREVNEDTMSKVKILFVRNLMLDTTEDKLRQIFILHSGSDPLAVERVKKLNDFAFIHFKERDVAEKCLKELNNTQIDGSTIEISWAKPAEKSQQQIQKGQAKILSPTDIMASAAVVLANGSASPDLSSYFLNQTSTGPLNLTQNNPSLTNQFLTNPVAASSPILSQNPFPNIGFNLNSTNGRFQQSRPGKRNAAGSRSVGSQRERKHPVEKIQKTQNNPLATFELLDEICKRNGYGSPQYEVTPCYGFQGCEQKYIYGYCGSVLFPLINSKLVTPNSYNTQEEARNAAAEYALLSLMCSQSYSYQMPEMFSSGIPFGISYLDSMPNLMNPVFSQPGPQIRCNISQPNPMAQMNCKSPNLQTMHTQLQNPAGMLENGPSNGQTSTMGQPFYPTLPGTSTPIDYLSILSMSDHLGSTGIHGIQGANPDQSFRPPQQQSQHFVNAAGDLLKISAGQQATSITQSVVQPANILLASQAGSTASLSDIQ